MLVLVGSTNAVNLTDGLDGLAIGLMIIAAGAMTVLAYVSGHARFADYLRLARLPGAAELTDLLRRADRRLARLPLVQRASRPKSSWATSVRWRSAAAWASSPFSSSRNCCCSSSAASSCMEALSVILQVGSFKLRGKRIFKMAPLHHHFEALGWKESKIIVRFWIVGLVLALFALTTLKLR